MTNRSDPRSALAPVARTSRQTGFTLIEVLAALIIVSLGMLGVIEAVTQTTRNGAYLRDKLLAQTLAMNRLTEVRLKLQAPDVDETSGEVDFAEARWRWTMKVSQTQVQSMRRIDMSVAPVDAPKGTSLATMTGFYGTALAPAGSNSAAWICVNPAQLGTQPPPGGTPGQPGNPNQPDSNPPGTPNPQGTPLLPGENPDDTQPPGQPEAPPEPAVTPEDT